MGSGLCIKKKLMKIPWHKCYKKKLNRNDKEMKQIKNKKEPY